VAERFLLDASALLALLGNEPGAERVMEVIERSSVHAVQLAEVVKKLVGTGASEAIVRETVESLMLPVIEELTADQAYHTARYCVRGISLGDQICLSVAESREETAVTSDRRWSEAAEEHPDWKAKVLLIR
jgi:PIN domain nuclease of toxin-antitoxin system